MPAVARIAGLKSGRLTAIEPSGSQDHRRLWLCACECGARVEVPASNLTSTKTKSCGCLGRDAAKARRGKPAPNAGRSYAIRGGEHVYSGKQNWARAVIRANGPACAICGWDEATCDVHHRVPKADGGLNSIPNGIVLCPNHHRIAHEHGLDACRPSN